VGQLGIIQEVQGALPQGYEQIKEFPHEQIRPTTRIVLVAATTSVLEMMHRRRVKIVANM
jgi:hypothetical protein